MGEKQTAGEAAVVLLRSRDKMWDALRRAGEIRGKPVDAADIHAFLEALAEQD